MSIVAASFVCGTCLQAPEAAILVPDEVGYVADCPCVHCDIVTRVGLTLDQGLRIFLAPPPDIHFLFA